MSIQQVTLDYVNFKIEKLEKELKTEKDKVERLIQLLIDDYEINDDEECTLPMRYLELLNIKEGKNETYTHQND